MKRKKMRTIKMRMLSQQVDMLNERLGLQRARDRFMSASIERLEQQVATLVMERTLRKEAAGRPSYQPEGSVLL